MIEIMEEHLPERLHRSNPRVVKKRISKFPSKKPFHRVNGSQNSAPIFRILSTA